MSVEIKEVLNNKDLKTFIRWPLTLYKDNPYYVPSLFPDEWNTLQWDKNAALKESKARYWLAYRDGKIVGRVAGIYVPKHEVKWGDKYVRFGWLDFIDDAEVVKALIGTVENWAKELGMNGVHGPLGFTDLDREGMLVEGYDELATLATYYNYPYYVTRLVELGYVKDVDWVEYEFHMTDQIDERIYKASDMVAKRYNLHLFQGKKRDLLKVAPEIFDVLEEAYRHLYGVVPLSRDQVNGYIDQYFKLAIMDYVSIVMDANEHVVAFGITFPSFSKALQKSKGQLFPFGFIHLIRAMTHNDRADLYLVGIRDEYLGKGLNAMLMGQIYKTFRKYGIEYVESNPNLEDNNDVQAMWTHFENRQHKRRRCFVKHLN
jgi:GNAT superfamily N-acetyltransferase